MKNKYFLLLILLTIITLLISTSCSKDTVNNKVKEEIIVGGLLGDYAKSYKSTNELYKDSDIVFKGLVESTRNIEKNGTLMTFVDFIVEESYKGDSSLNKITISVMGGVMDGDEFINSNIGKMFIIKGSTEAELKGVYSGKNVRISGFEGEDFPIIGERYIVYAGDLSFNGNYRYITGNGYDQGLFLVFDKNKVKEFNPEKRINKVELRNISIDQLINESK